MLSAPMESTEEQRCLYDILAEFPFEFPEPVENVISEIRIFRLTCNSQWRRTPRELIEDLYMVSGCKRSTSIDDHRLLEEYKTYC
ncbi:hypothetical protein OROGR_016490 [Orobanche gracilis]